MQKPVLRFWETNHGHKPEKKVYYVNKTDEWYKRVYEICYKSCNEWVDCGKLLKRLYEKKYPIPECCDSDGDESRAAEYHFAEMRWYHEQKLYKRNLMQDSMELPKPQEPKNHTILAKHQDDEWHFMFWRSEGETSKQLFHDVFCANIFNQKPNVKLAPLAAFNTSKKEIFRQMLKECPDEGKSGIQIKWGKKPNWKVLDFAKAKRCCLICKPENEDYSENLQRGNEQGYERENDSIYSQQSFAEFIEDFLDNESVKETIVKSTKCVDETKPTILKITTRKHVEHKVVWSKKQFIVRDTYDEDSHSFTHSMWKQNMNMVFAELVADETKHGDKIVYLDAKKQNTTNTLRARLGKSRKLFAANWHKDICDQLAQTGQTDHVQCGSIEQLLQNKWQKQDFQAAYLDVCTGSTSTISKLLQVLFKTQPYCKVLGFTMTQRDPDRKNQVGRLDQLDSEIQDVFPNRVRVEDLSKFRRLNWTESGIVTRFYILQ